MSTSPVSYTHLTTVFDVSQTEGEPIAELEVPELTGSVQFYDTFMQALQNISPVPILSLIHILMCIRDRTYTV